MHIPSITDEMLATIVEAAASPIMILFTEAGSPECHRLRAVTSVLADEFDDRVIFLEVNANENPSSAAAYAAVRFPSIVTIKRGGVVGRAVGEVDRPRVEELIEKAVAAK